MPELKCPKCKAPLREDDFSIWEGPMWMHNNFLTIQLACWLCSWVITWQAPNLIEEREEAK